MSTWELRRSLVYGSEHLKNYTTKASALRAANRDIEKHGSVGRVGYVDEKKRIVYYDVYEERA